MEVTSLVSACLIALVSVFMPARFPGGDHAASLRDCFQSPNKDRPSSHRRHLNRRRVRLPGRPGDPNRGGVMIFTEKPKKIRVMFTPFRDGLQSSFGGKVRLAGHPAGHGVRRQGGRHPPLRVRRRRPLPGAVLLRRRRSLRVHGQDAQGRGPGRRPADPHPLGLRRHADHPAPRGPRPAGQADGASTAPPGTATSTS